jgi:hypothetical protein
MAYEPDDRRPVIINEGSGYSAGVMAGALLVIVILALVGWYLLGGLRFSTGGGINDNNGNGGGNQPVPTVKMPGSS